MDVYHLCADATECTQHDRHLVDAELYYCPVCAGSGFVWAQAGPESSLYAYSCPTCAGCGKIISVAVTLEDDTDEDCSP